MAYLLFPVRIPLQCGWIILISSVTIAATVMPLHWACFVHFAVHRMHCEINSFNQCCLLVVLRLECFPKHTEEKQRGLLKILVRCSTADYGGDEWFAMQMDLFWNTWNCFFFTYRKPRINCTISCFIKFSTIKVVVLVWWCVLLSNTNSMAYNTESHDRILIRNCAFRIRCLPWHCQSSCVTVLSPVGSYV